MVEAAGAGLTADCPICNTSVTVPRPGAVARTDGDGPKEPRSRGGLTSTVSDSSRPNFADPVPDDLREELIDASLINGKLVRDLQKAREEITHLQAQLKSVGEECEHLNASSTHIQAELKTFQAERQQSKTELSALRQKFAAAEEALAARESEIKKAKAKRSTQDADNKKVEAKLATRESEFKKVQSRLVARESELEETRAKLAERELELKDMRAKLAESVPANRLTAAEIELGEAKKAAAHWESKTNATQQAREVAMRTAEEWKSKHEIIETSLAEAVKLLAVRDAEANAAAQQAQKLTAEHESKTAEFGRRLAEERAQRERLVAELNGKSQHLGETQARLSALDEELHKTRGRLGELESALSTARENSHRLATEQGELKQQLEEARKEISGSGDLKIRLAQREEELSLQSEKLRLAEDAAQTLSTRCDQLRREGDSLRREITDSHSGRELVETRSRLEDVTAERDRVATRLSAVESDLHAFTTKEKAARIELEQARAERDDALERVETLRETRAAQDNQVLRGIIARLNSDLAQRAAEVVRLKRARYALKVAYVIFAIGFLAVLVFAIMVLPKALQQ